MKLGRNTRQRIVQIKVEASQPREHLEQLLARLEEHPGTKRMSHKLARAIEYLRDWQREAA
jgi:hypothetical protein